MSGDETRGVEGVDRRGRRVEEGGEVEGGGRESRGREREGRRLRRGEGGRGEEER